MKRRFLDLTSLLFLTAFIAWTSACARGPRRAPPAERPVDVARELLVTDVSTVGDPVRAHYAPSPIGSPIGAWSFGALMTSLAGEQDPSKFTLDWLRLFERDLVIEGARKRGRPLALRPALRRWLERSGCRDEESCTLDFTRAPFRLTAIVSRLDLRNIMADGAVEDAGEGRFVFELEDEEGAPVASSVRAADPRSFSFIFEYRLPAKNASDVRDWADRWHALGDLEGETYRAALQRLTDAFARRGGMRNLRHIRTSEIGDAPWDLRDFSPSTDDNAAIELVNGKHMTCAGCHLDRADFAHVITRAPGEDAALSKFLVDAELPRRRRDFEALLSARSDDARLLRATERVD